MSILIVLIVAIQADRPGNSHPDVAYSAVHNRYMVVYRHVWDIWDQSKGNYVSHHSIEGQWYDANGRKEGYPFTIDNAPDRKTDRDNPTVTCPEEMGYCLIAWEDMRNKNITIYGRYIPNDFGIIDSDFPISNGEANQTQPAVAYGNDYYMVVWNQQDPNGNNVYSNLLRLNQAIPKQKIVDDATGLTNRYASPDITYDPLSRKFITVFLKARNTFFQDVMAFIRPANSDIVLLNYYPVTNTDETRSKPVLDYNPIKQEVMIAFEEGGYKNHITLQRFGKIDTDPGNIGNAIILDQWNGPGKPELAWNQNRKEYFLLAIISFSALEYKNKGVFITPEGVASTPQLLSGNGQYIALASGQNNWFIAIEPYTDNEKSYYVMTWPLFVNPALYYLLF
jgi:hypothetical protein